MGVSKGQFLAWLIHKLMKKHYLSVSWSILASRGLLAESGLKEH
jgi:uncharacterized membrane protein